MNKIRKLLNQSFPDNSSLISEIKSSIMLGLFVFLFLYLFKPFGMHQAGSMTAIYSFYFGIATTTMSLLGNLFIDHILKIDRQSSNWTFGKWLLSVLFVLVLIALANYYVMVLIDPGMGLHIKFLIRICYTTFLVGMFPVGFLGYIHLNKVQRENVAFAKNYVIPDSENNPNLIQVVKGDELLISLDQNSFIYAEAMQNYVAIYHLDGEDLVKKLIRLTLKELIHTIGNKHIVQCHRSFVCNLRNIESISGNSQGLRLQMKFADAEIPVSRSYMKLFK